MPRILVLYGTNTGNTAYAATQIAECLRQSHQAVDCQNVAYLDPATVPEHDLLIIGSSTWDTLVSGRPKEGQIQDQMEAFLRKSKLLQRGKPVAIFALGDSRFRYFCGAAVALQKHIKQAEARLIAEPLLIDSYPQFQTPLLHTWARQASQQWQEALLLQK
jgi:flavodoxin I